MERYTKAPRSPGADETPDLAARNDDGLVTHASDNERAAAENIGIHQTTSCQSRVNLARRSFSNRRRRINCSSASKRLRLACACTRQKAGNVTGQVLIPLSVGANAADEAL